MNDPETLYAHAKAGEIMAELFTEVRIRLGEDPYTAAREAEIDAVPWVEALNDGTLELIS